MRALLAHLILCLLSPCAHRNSQMAGLRRRPDVSVAGSASLQRKGRRPGFNAIGRDGYDRDFEVIVREYEMVAERAVRLKLDRPAIDRNLRLRMGAAIENDLRIDVHKKFSFS